MREAIFDAVKSLFGGEKPLSKQAKVEKTARKRGKSSFRKLQKAKRRFAAFLRMRGGKKLQRKRAARKRRRAARRSGR